MSTLPADAAVTSPPLATVVAPRWRAPDVALLLLAAGLIAGSWSYQGSSINLPVLFYLAVGLVVAAVWCSSALARSTAPFAHLRGVLLGVAAYLAICTSSPFSSAIPEVSSIHWWLRLALVVGVLLFVLFGSVERLRQWGRWTFAGVAVVCAVWGLIDFVASPRRAVGPFLDANNFASFCMLGIFLLLPDLGRRGIAAAPRLLLWCALTLLTIAVFAAYSRAMGLIWLFGVSAFAALAWRHVEARSNLVGYWLLGVACYLICTLLVPEVAQRVTGSGDLATTVEVRTVMITSAVEMWRASPLFGLGIGTFRTLYPMYRSTADQVTAGNTPHNDYVLGLVEGGPLLLGLYVALAIAVAWRGLRLATHLLRGQAVQRDDLIAAAQTLALGGLLAHAMLNFVTITLSMQFAAGCLIGMVFSHRLGAAANAAVRGEATALPGRLVWLTPVLVAALLLLPLRVLGQDAMAYAVFLDQPGMPFAAAIRADSERYLRFAAQLDALGPPRGLPSLGVATFFDTLASRSTGEAQRAIAARAEVFYEQSIEKLPNNSRVFLAWGKLRMRPWYRDLDKAHVLLEMSRKLDPTSVAVYQQLVVLARIRGDEREEYRVLRDQYFPWAYYAASTFPTDADRLLLDLEVLARRYGAGPSQAAIDANRLRAARVRQGVLTDRLLGRRD